MNWKQRPLAVTIIGWLYIVTGFGGMARHTTEFRGRQAFPNDLIWAELLGLAAVVAGAYLLRGRNWARWVALGWIASHVVISSFGPRLELTAHVVFCGVIAYFLFRPGAAKYFRAGA